MSDLKIESETELAEVAKQFFSLRNWDLYPEVVIDLFDGRPDYVGIKNNVCMAIECKKTLTYPVIEQLARWQIDAERRQALNRESRKPIAIPHLLVAFVGETKSRASELQLHLLNHFRLGVYSVRKDGVVIRGSHTYIDHNSDDYWVLIHGPFRYQIRLVSEPKIQPGSRNSAHRIIEALNPDMKIAQAGAKGGETTYMTPFRRTMDRVKQVLSDGKEHHISEIIRGVCALGGHHCSSDRAAQVSIIKFVEQFGIAHRCRKYGPWFVTNEQRSKSEHQ